MTQKKLSVKDRDTEIYKTLVGFLKDKKIKTNFPKPFDTAEVESLFSTTIWGYREVVLTIVMARLMNPKFSASKNFYECNPRSLFEHPIRKALREFSIPHKKSGPLNVAKNAQKINRDWATGKHGESVAMNVVSIVKKIENVSNKQLEQFAASYLARYKQEAKRVKNMEIKLPSQEDPIYIARLCFDLINAVPDGGATAQTIVGLIMETTAQNRRANVEISGHRDSVSATNTTSKKPGDIIEALADGSKIIYEVTTKMFSDDRMLESHEAVMNYDRTIRDVLVICRPEDVPESQIWERKSYVMGATRHKELTYYFMNIYEYVGSNLILMTPSGREMFYEQLTKYINETNTSEKVKIFFKEWHSKNKE